MENRCIDREIVDEFIVNKWLYQEKEHHNLVFVSYKNEKPVFITEKGIIQESRFMKEYPDNDYDHCFFVDYNSDTLVVVNIKIKITKKVGIIITSFGNEKLS